MINNNVKRKSVVEVIYDYKGFKSAEIYNDSDTYGKHFNILSNKLKAHSNGKENGKKYIVTRLVLHLIFLNDLLIKFFNMCKPILIYSATFLHFEESIHNLKWFLINIIEEKNVTPKLGNILLAKIVDMVIGIILLNWFLQNEDEVINIIQTTIADIVTSLKDLLLYLMGSPIGLKLNYAFNKTLGKFFFYHISLWRVFLQGMQPLLKSNFKYLVLPGALGFSFQIAMLSDIISIVTFHVYCIYVYAARLFSLQIRGLVSLWKLFIGRKYNPLRQRVDSCQYSQNQLFIGTLGFTISLFLLPTTMMYYAVFATFRLVILLIDGLLFGFRYLLNMLPLYVTVLWIFNASSLAGTIYIRCKNNCEQADRVLVEATLHTLPLTISIRKVIPKSMQPITSQSIGYIFHCMVTGVLV
ncbi:hypothetical protein NQ317_013718 [Molorchus minor]|uniref:Phosphatidylinositol N-acetylglucosaminyltransferase subunit Q n=1 Tax=Molorchus minor TaxID=1323400 RepID=A0ABQ9JRT2_9CUCU|nr:hypothetical protein NQ317_013718 [Molorchus minor]